METKMNFEEFKTAVVEKAKSANACQSQVEKLINSSNIDELIEVLKNNLSWIHDRFPDAAEFVKQYEKPKLFNSGKDNTGLFNSGYRNSGDRNSGYRNSGYRNSGYRNSGDLNSGDRNSGYRNSGDLNSGDRNSGHRNSGHRNSGHRNSGVLNSGDLNSGDLNSGDLNSGYRNSGDLNSGYRNSGVLCNRKKNDKVIIFNKESQMTWDEWYDHPAYYASQNLLITEWIAWDNMTDDEKKDHSKAFVCEGYVKVYPYHEAWANLWKSLSEEQKKSFSTLPNFDKDIFKDITGIDYQ